MRVDRLFTRTAIATRREATLAEAAAAMQRFGVGMLLVVQDAGDGVPVGIVTDRDIAIRGVAEGRDPGSTRVREIMSKDIVGVREESDVKEAERLMHDRQLRRLPVLNTQDELVGYLAIAKIARTESPEECGKVLQGVSQPSSTL